ncbi:MAG: dihydrolipoyl dehydrogenase family protein [Cuspidothrix sp.]
MSNIDYDIVIIGGTLAGYHAALIAIGFKAKVALIAEENFLSHSHINYQYIISQINHIQNQYQNLTNLGSLESLTKDIKFNSRNMNWEKSLLYAQAINQNINKINSLANLAAQGVDVIIGKGEFQAHPQLNFIINQRRLYSRTYLLANGSCPLIPKIPGLDTIKYLTLAKIWSYLENTPLAKNWVILGGVHQSIEIAQLLAKLGCQVTLIAKHPQILSHLDPEIAQLLIAQLEVDGVRVLNHTEVTQVRIIDNKKWLQAGNDAIETDEILIAIGQQPKLESLNLPAVGVKWHKNNLLINEKLQTTNHRIYACGDIIGGYDLPNIGNYEANIAVKNALFFPTDKINYDLIPWGINCQPMVGQVGLTETQAKRRYSSPKILVLKQYFKTATSAQIQREITGICKLIVLDNGQILGGAIFGQSATELINLITLAISEKINIAKLANLSTVYPSYTEVLVATSREWQTWKLNRNHTLQELLLSFFNSRRDWNL